jgi:hypothetical protein
LNKLAIKLSLACLAVVATLFPLALPGQSTASTALPVPGASRAGFLPDAPSVAPSAFSAVVTQSAVCQGGERCAPKYDNTIEPEYQGQSLGTTGKIAVAARQLISPQYAVGALIAAGLSQGLDSNPKYGSSSEAFAQRFGAAAARGASQIVFSKGILAPILHEDTRYYVLGPDHRVPSRILYAVSRIVITRSDSGHETLNVANLAGYGGSAALTQLYYPPGSRNASAILRGYGLSLGGLAIQDEIAEFVRLLARGQPR